MNRLHVEGPHARFYSHILEDFQVEIVGEIARCVFFHCTFRNCHFDTTKANQFQEALVFDHCMIDIDCTLNGEKFSITRT